MRILTGDECGLLKETVPEWSRTSDPDERKTIVTVEEGVNRIDPSERQSRSRGVVDMTFTSSCEEVSSSFAALRMDGSVEFWEGEYASEEAFGKYRRVGVTRGVFEETSSSDKVQKVVARPIALACCQDRLCAADSLGRISVLQPDGSVVAHYETFSSSSRSTLTYTKGQRTNVNIATAMAIDNQQRVAVSGRERETTLVDLESGKAVWKAKNLPPDPQTLLQQPVWSTALLFVNQKDDNHDVLAVGTAYKQVRLYDVRTPTTTRRPISYTPEGVLSHRVTALCQIENHYLVVGDAAGYLHTLDMRALGKRSKATGGSSSLGRFVGPGGSVRQIVKHDSLPVMAVVGLDRMLRTYDTTKRNQLDCVYLKQRLNCLLFDTDGTWSREDQSKVDGNFINDNDIDQEDRVQDYVDSDQDADESESRKSEEEESEESSNSEEEEDASESTHDDSEGSTLDEDQTDSESDEAERIQVQRAKKKRRA